MAGYIKSHSNYRLQSRHQTVNDGVILERDISTIGGVNSFATGQTTVYQSGNFVMVVNNSTPASRHIRKKSWLSPGNDSDMWDENVLSEYTSDINGSIEKKIMLKNDFMDFRSFAYYGSLADLIQNSILSILTKFPYEIYFGNKIVSDLPENITSGYTFYETSNPGNIDIHTLSGFTNNELGHFYGGGVDNYSTYVDGIENPANGYQFTWNVEPGAKDWCDAQSGQKKYACIVTIKYEIVDKDNSNRAIFQYSKNGRNYWHNQLRQDDLYVRISYNGGDTWSDSMTITNEIQIIGVYNQDDSIRYFHRFINGDSSVHIRPNITMGFYDDFIDGLDLFSKTLMGVYSGTRNVSRFEVLDDDGTTVRKVTRTFTFPTDEGEYNLGSSDFNMQNYISTLGKIGLMYDDIYTNNMLRMMTHDSLKNLDWTKNFNGENSEDSDYAKSGEKFSSMMRLIGYTFDNVKTYIDSIGNVNTITYSNRSNLSDYFLTDSLETEGLCVTSIFPYELTEFDDDGNVIDPKNTELWDSAHQRNNVYKRRFGENTTEIITPYSSFEGGYYMECYSGTPIETKIEDYSGQTYYVVDKNVYNVITDYHSALEMSIPDVNNEFMKRLRINSKQLLRKKGTIDGIESVLSLFGLKSKGWVTSNKYQSSGNTSFDYSITERTYISNSIVDEWDNVHRMNKIDWYNSCKTIPYDTESYINGIYVPYQGLPVAYRDIESNGVSTRKLYPFFSHNGIYDGDMYYQMNGGWIGFSPYVYDINDKIIDNDANRIRKETMRNVMQVKNITELINQPISELNFNSIYYVTDTSDKFAVINGFVYPLKEESVSDGSVEYYFTATVYGSSINVGGELYDEIVTVSSKGGTEEDFDLNLYSDGSSIKIYYTGNRNNAFVVDSNTRMPESSLIFIDGSYNDYESHKSHYFQLSNSGQPDLLGDGYGWSIIPNTSELYLIIDNIIDDTTGNNPHSGNMAYDNGSEYLGRFNKLFKYASENRYFNESCFPDIIEAYEDIDSYGFKLKNCIDTKTHTFSDIITENGTEVKYDINSVESIRRIPEYNNIMDSGNTDSVTSQIINVKNFDLVFYIHYNLIYSKDAQEEIKYIQAKIMPYVEQMIPSTAILNVHFIPNNSTFDNTFDYTFN